MTATLLVSASLVGPLSATEPAPEPSDGGDEGWLISPGDVLPDVALEDVDGVGHHLREFAGHPLVLIFWGTW